MAACGPSRYGLRPAPRQEEVGCVAFPDPAVVRDQHQKGECQTEGHQDDVDPERERHLLSCGQELRGSAELDSATSTWFTCGPPPTRGLSGREDASGPPFCSGGPAGLAERR